jgi:hypothetical protein
MHMIEEFYYPGEFMRSMKKLNPKFAPFVNAKAAIVINGLQILLCILVIIIGEINLAFSLSIASLVFINFLVHVAGAIKTKGYAPGLITAVVIYLPLSVYSYYHYFSTGLLNTSQFNISLVLGIAYQLVPLVYFISAKLIKMHIG